MQKIPEFAGIGMLLYFAHNQIYTEKSENFLNRLLFTTDFVQKITCFNVYLVYEIKSAHCYCLIYSDKCVNAKKKKKNT